jgi:hypothetical protein
MNRSFSKLRNIQVKNFILENKFLEKRPKKSIISEGEEFVEPTFDKVGGGGEDQNLVGENCKNKTPYNVVTELGLNFREVQKKWIDSGCMSTQPCSYDEARKRGVTNVNLKKAICDGKWDPKTSSANSNNKTDSDKVDFNDPMFGGSSGTKIDTQKDSQVLEF